VRSWKGDGEREEGESRGIVDIADIGVFLDDFGVVGCRIRGEGESVSI
jgi:hypothetical protein